MTSGRSTCDTSLVRSHAIGLVTALALGALLAPRVAHAERPDLTHGRGFVYGASATVPILVGTLRYAEPPNAVANYVAPGFGTDARAGIELDGGFRLELAGGVDGHAVEGQIPLARYRVGVQARYTLDLGGDFYPFFGVGAALALFNRNNSLSTTFDVRGLVGGGWWPEPWFALEIALAVDVTPPGFAFTDTFAVVTPMIGVDLCY